MGSPKASKSSRAISSVISLRETEDLEGEIKGELEIPDPEVGEAERAIASHTLRAYDKRSSPKPFVPDIETLPSKE